MSQRPYVASILATALHVRLLLLSESSSSLLSKDVKTLDNTGIYFSDVLFAYKYFLFLMQNALHLWICRALKRWYVSACVSLCTALEQYKKFDG